MSYSSNYVLNERVSYLEWEVNNLNPPPGGYTLSNILAQGNSAGAYDINLNNNDLLNADAVSATTLNVAGVINLQNTTNRIYNDSTNNTIITIPTGKSVNIQSPAGSTQLAVSSTGATATTPFQFNGNVSVGSTSTTNLTPTINTYKSQVNLGNAGNGSIDVECPLGVGGFGSITMNASNINFNSGGRINQGVLTTTSNTLATTEVLSSYGATATSTLYVQDSSGAQGINFIPNASGGAYNPLIGANDCEVVVKGSATNTKNLSLTTWASANTGVKITPTSTTIGAGGTSTAPTTGTTYDGSNITLTSPNPPLSTATQPATSDNSNKMPTTAWVQSLFATIPSPTTIMPYLWGVSPNWANFSGGSGAIAFNFTGGSWGQNQYFTIRFQLEQTYILGGNAVFPYFQSWGGLIDVYPNRIVTTNTTPAICLLNGTINGNNAYALTDPTYAPNGRFYWTRSYQNSSALNTGSPVPPANPISILTTNGTQFIINVTPPNTGTGAWRLSATIELIQQGGLPVTTSGVSGLFTGTGGSFYTSF